MGINSNYKKYTIFHKKLIHVIGEKGYNPHSKGVEAIIKVHVFYKKESKIK